MIEALIHSQIQEILTISSQSNFIGQEKIDQIIITLVYISL